MPTIEDLQNAQRELHARGFDPAVRWPTSRITKTYVGIKLVAGKDAGDGVIVCVEKKHTKAEMQARGLTALPAMIAGLPTDVQEEPRAEMLRLPTDSPKYLNPLAGEDHRRCYDPPPGGVEMQPQGKSWVGTFGGLAWFRFGGQTYYGGITNWHVSGDGMQRGHSQLQPGGGNLFGSLVAAAPITFDGSPNYLDLALLNCVFEISERLVAKVWCAAPRQLKGGPVAPGIGSLALRDAVRRDGRTLGYLDDVVCVGISARYQVGMGSGRMALFADGDVLRRSNGKAASAGGDSGSIMVRKATNQAASHLHAGGGNDTMALPFRNFTRFLGLEELSFTVPA